MSIELEDHIAQESSRLDRIEEKIDKLSDAMVSLARTEEKILQMEHSNRNTYERMNRFSEKLDRVERTVNDNSHTVKIISNLSYILIAAVIGGMIQIFWT